MFLTGNPKLTEINVFPAENAPKYAQVTQLKHRAEKLPAASFLKLFCGISITTNQAAEE